MAMLAADPRTLFVGQSIKWDGHALFRTLQSEDGELLVPQRKRIELPVAEEFQMGFSMGLAMEGYIPVSIFPRWDFLLIGANQLVNHLDKVTSFAPKVIIRTTVGATIPLHSGPQHTQNHTDAFRLMLKNVKIMELLRAEDVMPTYAEAMNEPGSFLIVEHQNLYNP